MNEALSFDLYADLLGVPFVRGGRDPKRGLDCYGLARLLFYRMGKPIPDFNDPGSHEKIEALIKEQQGEWKRVEEKAGSLLLFNVEGYQAHVGVLVDKSRMIHCHEPAGVQVTHRIYWPRLIAAYDYEPV